MRSFTLVMMAMALAFASSAYADGMPTTVKRFPLEGRTLGQVCRAAQEADGLPWSIERCVAEARSTRADGYVSITVLAPQGAAAEAVPPDRLAEAGGWGEPPEDTANDTNDESGRPWWIPAAILGVLAAICLGLIARSSMASRKLAAMNKTAPAEGYAEAEGGDDGDHVSHNDETDVRDGNEIKADGEGAEDAPAENAPEEEAPGHTESEDQGTAANHEVANGSETPAQAEEPPPEAAEEPGYVPTPPNMPKPSGTD